MTSITPGFIGRRLNEARKARGMSATDLAAIVGVSPVSISKYENGHQTPRLDVFHSLASALKMPRAYFLRSVGAEEQSPIFWRSRLSAQQTVLDRAAVRLVWMREIVDYIASFFDFMPLNIPCIERPLDSFDAIEQTASEIRNYWGIRSGPFPDVIEKLENNGVLVSRIHVGAEKVDAFSQWSSGFGIPFVVLSRDKASAVRQRFDALHELCHLVAHRSVSQKRMNDRKAYKVTEQQADRLACALLLPKKEFLDDLYAPSLDAFVTAKEYWGASVGAMIMRCNALDLLDEDESRRMWINYNRRGWRDGEPLDGKLRKETPYMIRRSFEKLLSENVRSVGDILTALPFPPAEIEEIADLPPGTLSGHVETRPEPILKEEFRTDQPNVISLFNRKV